MWKPITITFVVPFVMTTLIPVQSLADCREAYKKQLQRQGQNLHSAWDHVNGVQAVGYISGAAVAIGITVFDAVENDDNDHVRPEGIAVGAAAGAAIVGGAATVRAASSSTYDQKAKDYDNALTLLNQAVVEDGMDLQIFANSLINTSAEYSQFTVEDVTYALQKGNQDGSFCKVWHEPASMDEIRKKVRAYLK